VIIVEVVFRNGEYFVTTNDPITLMKSQSKYTYRKSVDLYLDVMKEEAGENGFDIEIVDKAK
jgi:hypothetical protein